MPYYNGKNHLKNSLILKNYVLRELDILNYAVEQVGFLDYFIERVCSHGEVFLVYEN